MRVQFIGGTETVTGSKYLLSYGKHKVLIDCGLFQGVSNVRRRNWQALPFDASDIEAILLTHAHIDHSGYIPALVNKGFQGPVYTSRATHALCKILLPDSGFLQEEDAKYANKKRYSKHNPALPLYTEEDAYKALKHFKVIKENQMFELDGGLKVTFAPAGHILGACSIRLEYHGKSITFSGDVGRCDDAIMYPPQPLKGTDYLVVESTYGDKLHETLDVEAVLTAIINRTIKRGGIVLMPAFAVGRAQTILHHLQKLRAQDKIPKTPIYLNSPMAIKATQIFMDCTHLHKLNADDCEAMDDITTYIKTTEESIALSARREPCIIISASGMASGGRVLHHLKTLVTNERNCILFMGYQAPGTRGFSLVNGAEHVKIHGEYFPVHAEIVNLDAMSSHADYGEITRWLKQMPGKPRKVFITHGESSAADAMRLHLADTFDWDVEVPEYLETFEL
jgi:metallo-beta-lactamase family protein